MEDERNRLERLNEDIQMERRREAWIGIRRNQTTSSTPTASTTSPPTQTTTSIPPTTPNVSIPVSNPATIAVPLLGTVRPRASTSSGISSPSFLTSPSGLTSSVQTTSSISANSVFTPSPASCSNRSPTPPTCASGQSVSSSGVFDSDASASRSGARKPFDKLGNLAGNEG